MKRLLALAVIALVVPTVALAAKPPAPGKSQTAPKSQNATNKSPNSHSKAAPKVMYVLRGVLDAYEPATDSAPGLVTISVNSANHHRAALKQTTLTFTISTATKVVVRGGGELTPTDKGIVKLRFAKKFDPSDPAQLSQFLATTPKQVIDQGPATPNS